MDPRLLIHPGEILKEEFLVPFGLSSNRLAKAIGVPTNRITEIVNGTRGITGETAVLLGHAFGTTPEFWLNLQSRYELDVAIRVFHRTRSAGQMPFIESCESHDLGLDCRRRTRYGCAAIQRGFSPSPPLICASSSGSC